MAEPLQDQKPTEAYQTIANQLPEIDLGWGDAPAVARMAASERGQPKPERPDLYCDERRFRLYVDLLHPRVFEVKYDAIEEVSYAYSVFPNVLFCVICPFLQRSEVRVVFDARKVDGLLSYIEDECSRLEHISPEIGMSGPYDHALAVRAKCRDDAHAFGEGRLSFELDYMSPVPPYVPYTAKARHIAEAFAWVKAHPDEPPAKR
jgi:hypothetical protein